MLKSQSVKIRKFFHWDKGEGFKLFFRFSMSLRDLREIPVLGVNNNVFINALSLLIGY